MRRTMIEELFSNCWLSYLVSKCGESIAQQIPGQVKVGNFVFQKAAKVFASSLALNKKK